MKIVIFGIGKSGISAIKLALHHGHQVKVVNQGNPDEWRSTDELLQKISRSDCYDQKMAKTAFEWADLIVKSPGIDPRIDELKHLDQKKIISEIEWAFRYYQGKAKIISITGSNGKTTTSTMLAKYLEIAGNKVFLGGNIGTPIADFILSKAEVDFIVLELSSFQLENIEKFKSDYSVILNIFENHMERYSHIDDYAKAKYNLVNHTKEKILVNRQSHGFFSSEKIIPFETTAKVTHPMLLPGEHNKQNAFVVEEILKLLKIDLKNWPKFLLEFGGVEHRLEFVGDFKGLKVFNDSKSTNMIALEAALSGLGSEDNYLILSGKPRGGEKVEELLSKYKSKLKKIYAYGDCCKILPTWIEKRNSLDEIITDLKSKTGKLIFSPGFPSYDLYKNFELRGLDFKQKVKSKLSL